MTDRPFTGSLRASRAGLPLRISPPWTWTALVIIAVATVAALIASWFVHVETTTRARGIVRPAGGVRALVAQTDASVAEVLIRSGDHVEAGTTVVRLEGIDVEAALFEPTRAVAIHDEARRGIAAETGYVQQRASILERLRIAQGQIASYEASVLRQKRHVETVESLRRSGLMSDLQAYAAQEQYDAARRSAEAGRDAQTRLRQELAALDAAHERELREAEGRVNEAKARREGIELPARKSAVDAPVAGTVEGIVVRRGDAVQAGQTLAKLVPDSATLHVVAFLPERDRAFVRPGTTAKLELDQYPYSEFGTIPVRITRIGTALASGYEIREAFGDSVKDDESPRFRVELEIAPQDLRDMTIRPGMMAQVRVTLRRQRALSLLFAPLARWSDAP
jgi:multidrug resistance efflux pump